MKLPPKLEHLFSLLDDEDENIAVAAIAELLDYETELGDALSEFQESSNPLMRRRVHQLQAALTLRRRRREFARNFSSGREFDLADALIETHLLWFDNDARPMLENIWRTWHDAMQTSFVYRLEDISLFMLTHNFHAREETTGVPEVYCMGPVLENRSGTASALCAILLSLLPEPERFLLVAEAGEFALADRKAKRVLRPLRNWFVGAYVPAAWSLEFSNEKLVRYLAMTLFSNAVNSDSFRYVLTIAQAVTGEEGADPLRAMPYPYFPADEEDNESGDDNGDDDEEENDENDDFNDTDENNPEGDMKK